MDPYLLEYLRSGQAWVLVGSGPSNALGYPSWRSLAASALALSKAEGGSVGERQFRDGDLPAVFGAVADDVGLARLVQYLRERLKPSAGVDLYSDICRWPVGTYLTTNYDDELQRHLSSLGADFRTYGNGEDHLALLVPGFTGGVFTLHGDLTTTERLILTADHYSHVREAEEWEYWRTKLTSIFQMTPTIVVGHSLTDPHVSVVLEAAKKGSGVIQPVIWLAPDVTISAAREYLEKYRIRVVPYENGDGTHRNLRTMLSDYTTFVQPRESIRATRIIRETVEEGRDTAGAAAFFVYNRINALSDATEKRIEAGLAAIEVALESLSDDKPRTIKQLLEVAGWPAGTGLSHEFEEVLAERAIRADILAAGSDTAFFGVGGAKPTARLLEFDHLRERFRNSLRLRINRTFPRIAEPDVDDLCVSIDASLTGFFRKGGLTLATFLFANDQGGTAPPPASIARFASEASTIYDDPLRRQAFVHVVLEAFVQSSEAERQYLGRLSQGFFAFHALGAFGEVAIQRLREAQDTVWLLDSNVQIPALALGAPANAVVARVLTRFRAAGIRMFSTGRIFDETARHLEFARKIVADRGADSYDVIAAANGQSPYRRQNQFLQGFIQWRDTTRSTDWELFLGEAIGDRSGSIHGLLARARKLGIEVTSFDEWPGFMESDYGVRDGVLGDLLDFMRARGLEAADGSSEAALERKALPEAESAVVVANERIGRFHALSDPGVPSRAWFVSSTSAINAVCGGPPVTWQPEAFLEFASTLATEFDPSRADEAFEILLWQFARSGATPVPEETIGRVFGGVIDQARLGSREETDAYNAHLSDRYGEPAEAVIDRLRPSQRMLGALQIKNEVIQSQASDIGVLREQARDSARRASSAETELDKVARYRRKVAERAAKTARRQRQASGRTRKKKRGH